MNKIKQAFLHLRDNRGDEHTARMIWVAIAFLTGAILFSVVFASISGPMHNWFDNLNEDLYVDGSDGEYAPGTPGGDYGGSGGGTPDAPVNPPDVDIISSPGLYDHSGMLIYTWDELIARGYLSVFEDILTPGSQVMPAGKLVCKDAIKTVGLYAFANQTNLTSIFLGDSVVYISDNAFSGLSTLSSVRLPASLAYIGADAFTNCTNLSNITYGGTQVQWRAINKEAGWNAGMPHYAVHCVDGSIYPIILQLIENATITPNYPTDVGHGEQAELFFTAMNDYSLPATITVLGAEYTWDLVSGKLTITNPSDFVYVYISGEKTGCRVVFDANTGTVDPTFKRVVYNLPYGTLPTPVKTGYNFVGWFTAKTGGSEVTAASLVPERNDHTVYAHWAPKTDTPYTVHHYYMNLDGSYPSTGEVQSLKGTTDATVTPAVIGKTGFTSPTTQTVTINPDGSTVVKYYYTRNQYTVSLNKGTGITGVSGAGTYYYGETVTINATVKTGYTWKNWNGTVTSNTQKYVFAMPANNLNLTANATARTDITYTVYHYYMGLDGKYPATGEAMTYTGTTDTQVTAPLRGKTGFTSPSEQKVTINGDGSTVVHYKYERQKFTLTLDKTAGITQVTGAGTYYYGASVTVSRTVAAGYNWTKWTGSAAGTSFDSTSATYTFTMPAANLTLKANATARTDTTYKVNHYYMGLDGKYSTPTTQTFTGTTDTNVTPAVVGQTGFTSPATQTVKINGNGTTVVDYYYTRNQYTVTLTKGTGISAVTGANKYYYGATVVINATVTDGYRWNNWTGTFTETTQRYSFAMPANDVSLTANATIRNDVPYTVYHYYMNLDGTYPTTGEVQNYTGTTNASVTPPLLGKTGFTSPATQTVTIKGDGSTVVKYYYSRNQYTVTVNKGTGVSAVTGGGTYYYGASVTINATMATGYTWGSWSGTHTTTTQKYTFTMPANNVNDTANAKANTYTVVYNGNGNTGGSTASSTHTYDVAKALTANGFTNNGYSFIGWATTKARADAGTVDYADKASVKNLTATAGGTVTLYAVWKANTYYVVFDANGGTNAPPNQAFVFNSGTKLTTAIPTRTGYTFVKWVSNPNNRDFAPGDTIPNGWGGFTLIAQWEVNKYTLTIDKNDGSAVTTVTQDYGSTYTVPTPTRNGYTFAGWTLSGSGSVSGSVYTFGAGHGSLKANWTPNTITITLNPAPGSGGTTKVYYKYGINKYYSDYACTQQITAITRPTRAGYTFVNYHGDGTSGGLNGERYIAYDSVEFAGDLCTDIYKDATFSATWSANTYTITYQTSPKLPAGYTALTYIESNGQQYIDTGFTPNSNTRIVTTFMPLNAANNGCYIYGSGVNHQTQAFELYPWADEYQFNYGSSNAYFGSAVANQIVVSDHNKTSVTLTQNGSTVTETHTANSFTTPGTLYLFALNRAGNVVTSNGGLRIYACQIYDNGVLVRDLVPCKASDGSVGMYDWVSGKFYGNKGTGSFTAGAADTTSVSYTPDTNLTLNTAPSMTGYTFAGWKVAASVGNWTKDTVYTSAKNIGTGKYGNVTLVAQWTINSSTLTVNPNGGSWNGSTSTQTFTQNYSTGKTIGTPTRAGYTFAGWTLTGGGTWDGSAYTFGTANGTLTANWTATSYTITYTNPMGLPSGYTPLEYIESTGTQYIDTGYVAPNGYMADVQFAYMATNPGSYIIGSHNTGAPYGRNGFGITGTGYWELGTGDTCPQSSAGPAVGTIYVANISTVKGFSSVSLNGQTIIRTSDSTSRSSHNVLLFYEQYGQYHGSKSAQARIYYAKIYDTDGTLVRDFIPCKNASGTIGMYDLVAGKFYGNAGSGTFVAGPAKWPTSSTYNINTNLVAPTAPYKNAYAFTGWKVTSAVGNWTTGESYRGDVTIGTGKYGNVTLEATWVKNNMTLTVNPNGGTWEGSTATQKFVQKYGSSIAISTPTRPGYTFAGWTIDNSGMCSGTHYVFGPNPATLTAQWTPNTYTLNYVTPVAGTSSTNITGIVPNGYTILEYIASSGTQWIDSGVSIAGNTWVDVDLMWTSAFDYNMMFGAWSDVSASLRAANTVCAAGGGGATQNVGSTTAVNVKYNIKIGADKGYTQNGTKYSLGSTTNAVSGRHILLFAASDGSTGNNPYAWSSYGVGRIYGMRIYNGSTLVRNFIPCKNASGTIGMYDLVEGKFYTNKGTGTFTAGPAIGSSTTITYTPATSLTINAAPSATGYTFGGWKVQSSTDGSWTNGATFSGSQSLGTGKYGNAILVAQWTINSYTLTVNPNGGSWNGSTSSQAATQNYKTTKSIPNPTRTGYAFAGWSLSGGGSLSGTTYTYGAGNATLTANWRPNVYAVTLNNQSASVAGTTSYYYQFNTTKTINGVTCYYYTDVACTNPLTSGYYITVPKKAGYVFGGYYTGTNGSGTQYVDSTGQCVNNILQSVASNTTLYAKWTASTYTYAYNANGGSGSIANQTPAWNTSFNLSSGFSRTGWTFNGYYVQRSTDGRWVSTGGWATEAEIAANGWTKSYYQPGELHTINSSWVDPYIGSATFTFYAQWTAIPYTLDINGLWDGVVQGGLADRGTFDIYINGTLVGNDVTDYYNPSMTYGDTYQVTDVKRQSAAYQRYAAQDIGAQSGSITGDTNVMLSFVPAYYTITSKATFDSTWHTSSDTGNMEYTYIGINGTEMPDASRVTFANSNPTDIWTYPYGTEIGVAVADKYDNDGGAHSYITWNGTMVAGKASYSQYVFGLSSDVVINMEYNAWLTGVHWNLDEVRVAYWNCYITSTERDYYVP